MSFLWRNTQTETLTNDCKDCTDKEKRISDYEVFFNEMKDVFKKKEDSLIESQKKIDELNRKIDDQDVTIQTQIAFREKLISEYETNKKIHMEERRQWVEDRGIWLETKKLMDETMMEYEVEKSKLEEEINQLSDEKKIWKNQQKWLEEKVAKLNTSLKDSNDKYEDLVSQMRKLELLKEEELQLKEDHVIFIYRNKMDILIEENEKKEEEWKAKEEEYEMMLQQYQDNELDYEMKIQELKYDLNCRIDDVVNEMEQKYEQKYKTLMEERDEEWSERVKSLNETYDTEFVQFKEHFKNKEQKLEREKETMEQTFRYEIDVLKHENLLLEDAKRQMEKKRTETTNQWTDRENALISQIESIALDNQRLEKESKASEDSRRISEENRRISEDSRRISEDIQKKMEKEVQKIKVELERSQKILENTIVDVVERTGDKLNKETQTTTDKAMYSEDEHQSKEPINYGMYDSPENDLGSCDGLVKRPTKKKKMKRKHPFFSNTLDTSLDGLCVETRKKNDEKKTENISHTMSQGKLYSQSESSSTWCQPDHVIDIQDDYENIEESSNFFLPIIGFLNTLRVDNRMKDMEKKISNYEQEIQLLREQNKEYLKKIQGYECNSILELNRKIRSGIPVRFFPYTSSHGLSNTSHINSVELDLH
jgi:hypothetical protein